MSRTRRIAPLPHAGEGGAHRKRWEGEGRADPHPRLRLGTLSACGRGARRLSHARLAAHPDPPAPLFFAQLLVGLINGAFYAMLSLGLAVIFGLLNIINFTHGAQYMLGAFCAWFLLTWLGIGYWPALIDRAGCGRHHRHRHRAGVSAPARRARSPLRPAADLRAGADHRRRVPAGLRLVGPALHYPAGAAGRAESRLHVPALLPRLGHRRLAGGLSSRHGSSSSAPASAPICGPRPRTRSWCRPSASTCRAW